MQQFVVPQFIEVEDKIIGPITVRQFIILLVTGLLIFLAYKLADFSLFVLLALVFLGIGGILAFLKINGQPFHYFLLNLIQTFRKPRLRIWDKTYSQEELRSYIQTEKVKVIIPRVKKEPLAMSRLAQLSLIVDTGGAYKGED